MACVAKFNINATIAEWNVFEDKTASRDNIAEVIAPPHTMVDVFSA
jgi:hypothetical protein